MGSYRREKAEDREQKIGEREAGMKQSDLARFLFRDRTQARLPLSKIATLGMNSSDDRHELDFDRAAPPFPGIVDRFGLGGKEVSR